MIENRINQIVLKIKNDSYYLKKVLSVPFKSELELKL